MKAFYSQKQQEIAQLLKQQRSWQLKAERCVAEMNWRLNPAGGPENIEIEKTEQAMNELTDAIRRLRRIRADLEHIPPEMRSNYQEEI